VWITLAVGFLQDPLRKLWPGQPVFLVATCLVFFAAAFAGALLRGLRLEDPFLRSLRRALRGPLSLMAILLVSGILLTIAKTQSAAVVVIGVISYFTPLPAVLMGYRFARKPWRIDRFIGGYVAAVCVMASGVYLYMLGYDNVLLVPVTEWLDVYGPHGTVHLLPGFFRTAENAAWHGSSAICLLIVRQAMRHQRASSQWLAATVASYLTGAVLLTGRRKAVVEIGVFFVLYGILAFLQRRGSRRVLSIGLASVLGSALFVKLGYFDALTGSGAIAYVERGQSVVAEISDRVDVTLRSYKQVIAANGVFGAGVGMGSQGAQHFGAGMVAVGGAAESGPAKVLAELGVPGICVAAWLLFSAGRLMWRKLTVLRRSRARSFIAANGLVCFLAANGAVFLVNHQIFGDPFVLLMLGWITGFILALVREAEPLVEVEVPGAAERSALPPLQAVGA